MSGAATPNASIVGIVVEGILGTEGIKGKCLRLSGRQISITHNMLKG